MAVVAELGPLPGPTLDIGGRRLALGPFPLATPLLDLVPPLLHDGIDAKNVLEIAGLGALLPWNPRFAAWPEGGRATRAMASTLGIARSGPIGSDSSSAEAARAA